jgi:hypothetical protein
MLCQLLLLQLLLAGFACGTSPCFLLLLPCCWLCRTACARKWWGWVAQQQQLRHWILHLICKESLRQTQ